MGGALGAPTMVAVAARAGRSTSLRAPTSRCWRSCSASALIVTRRRRHGAATSSTACSPRATALLALLGATAVAAVLANLLNNLPAVLVLLPAAAAAGTATVLAVLIGVNAGPNLTPTGSLATLLWRRVLRDREAEPSLGEFLRLGR